MRGEGGSCRVSVNEYSCTQEPNNFGDLTPFLHFNLWPPQSLGPYHRVKNYWIVLPLHVIHRIRKGGLTVFAGGGGIAPPPHPSPAPLVLYDIYHKRLGRSTPPPSPTPTSQAGDGQPTPLTQERVQMGAELTPPPPPNTNKPSIADHQKAVWRRRRVWG
jgi:hypothetical protein